MSLTSHSANVAALITLNLVSQFDGKVTRFVRYLDREPPGC
jgi:hypothetical protein